MPLPNAVTKSPAKPPAEATVLETVGAMASDTLLSTQPVAMIEEVLVYWGWLPLGDLIVVFTVLAVPGADLPFFASFNLGIAFFVVGLVALGLVVSSSSVTSEILEFSLSV